jgi:hypothetical protein
MQLLPEWFRAAILNQGYMSSLQGVHIIVNQLKVSPFLSFLYTKPDTNGVMRVHVVLQSCSGSTIRSNIMIWGYASTKSLRTPGLRHFRLPYNVCVNILLGQYTTRISVKIFKSFFKKIFFYPLKYPE